MKRLIQLVVVFVFATGIFTANAQEKSKITFEKTTHDYGSFVESDGSQAFDFVFTNEGTVPLVLTNVRASCGCTTPKWTREPVAPGAKGTIKVSYDPKNRPGSFTKTITVNSNAENSTVMLKITGNVKPREKTLAEKYPRQLGSLRVKRNHISFVKIKKTDVKTERLELVNDTDKPVKIGFKTVPKELSATLSGDSILAHATGWVEVTFDASKVSTYGFVSKRLYLTIDGNNDYKNSIGCSATVEEDFSALTEEELANAPVVSFPEKSHDFGTINQGDKVAHTFHVKNEGINDLIIRRVKTSCGCTAGTPSKNVIAAGETTPIEVEFNSRGKKGKQTKTITVITNDPKNPTSTLRIISQVNVAK